MIAQATWIYRQVKTSPRDSFWISIEVRHLADMSVVYLDETGIAFIDCLAFDGGCGVVVSDDRFPSRPFTAVLTSSTRNVPALAYTSCPKPRRNSSGRGIRRQDGRPGDGQRHVRREHLPESFEVPTAADSVEQRARHAHPHHPDQSRSRPLGARIRPYRAGHRGWVGVTGHRIRYARCRCRPRLLGGPGRPCPAVQCSADAGRVGGLRTADRGIARADACGIDAAAIRGKSKSAHALELQQVWDLRAKLAVDENAVDLDLVDFVDMMLATGLRIGETAAITWPAVDLDSGSVEIRGTVIRIRGEGLGIKPKPKSEAGWRSVELVHGDAASAGVAARQPVGRGGHLAQRAAARSKQHSGRSSAGLRAGRPPGPHVAYLPPDRRHADGPGRAEHAGGGRPARPREGVDEAEPLLRAQAPCYGRRGGPGGGRANESRRKVWVRVGAILNGPAPRPVTWGYAPASGLEPLTLRVVAANIRG